MTMNDIVKEYIRDLDRIIADDFSSEIYSKLVDLAASYFSKIYKLDVTENGSWTAVRTLPGIIRCKDCKWWRINDKDDDKRCVKLNGYWYSNDYCSCAERREI